MSTIDLLAIGGSGFIGAKVVNFAFKAGLNVAFTYSRHPVALPVPSFQVSLEDPQGIEDCIRQAQPRAIIYCAVPPPGSSAEMHELVSVEGVRRTLAVLDRSVPCRFIYVSTNAVFSGKDGPYAETSLPDPEERQDKYRVYALTRAQGEQVALESWPNSIVARTADVNGNDIYGKLNPRLANLVEQLRAGSAVERLVRGFISPTWVDNLAECLLEISSGSFDYRGVLHLAGSQRISYYEFARAVARAIHTDEGLVKEDHSRAWDISLDTHFTQRVIKTKLLGFEEQLAMVSHDSQAA